MKLFNLLALLLDNKDLIIEVIDFVKDMKGGDDSAPGEVTTMNIKELSPEAVELCCIASDALSSPETNASGEDVAESTV